MCAIHLFAFVREMKARRISVGNNMLRRCDVYNLIRMRPVGLMDKASASGAGDSRFESWAGHFTNPLTVF